MTPASELAREIMRVIARKSAEIEERGFIADGIFVSRRQPPNVIVEFCGETMVIKISDNTEPDDIALA